MNTGGGFLPTQSGVFVIGFLLLVKDSDNLSPNNQ
jgi:hypothetical protein